MRVEPPSFAETPSRSQTATQEVAEREHKTAIPSVSEPEREVGKIAPEEFLTKIKDLTGGGAYGVRFEMDKAADALVIHLVDTESGEIIRQIPPEELLGISKALRELRGILLDTQG